MEVNEGGENNQAMGHAPHLPPKNGDNEEVQSQNVGNEKKEFLPFP